MHAVPQLLSIWMALDVLHTVLGSIHNVLWLNDAESIELTFWFLDTAWHC